MIKHFLIIAWRNIRRRKMLSFIQIMCLSLGLAAFILVARYVQYEKDYDKFNTFFDRLYRVQSYKIGDKMDDDTQTVVPLAKYLRENIPEVEDAIIYREIWGEYLSSDVEHVFDKFYRVEANKKFAKGTGLGLNLVRQIIETVHNGNVFVTSTVGEGSTFGFDMALAMNQPEEAVK